MSTGFITRERKKRPNPLQNTFEFIPFEPDEIKQEPEQNGAIEFLSACVFILILSCIGLLVFLIITYNKATEGEVRLVTRYEDNAIDLFPINAENFPDTLAFPCTNKTLGTDFRTFTGYTFPGIPCPKSDNQCATFLCGMDAYCHFTTIPGGECYSNSQCNGTDICDLNSCNCIPFQCNTASDCQQILGNDCLETSCISNVCVTDLITGAECSSTTSCPSFYSCNQTCQCEPMPDSPECSIDSDCDQFEVTDCIESKCISNMCVTNLTSSAECAFDNQCGDQNYFFCNSTCMCEAKTECQIDSDCQQVSGNDCLETKCILNRCITNLTTGAECSSTTSCPSFYSCNQTCQCEPMPDSPECSIDSDCDQFAASDCIESKCINQMCVTNLTSTASCAFDSQCGDQNSFFCNSTCMCEEKIECLIDSDCEQFNGNSCLETKCITNKCSTNLIGGAACAFGNQCSNGYSCNSTCQCEEIQIVTICTVDSDCDQFNANSCIEAKCTSNTCSYELTPGATCSSTTQCSSGFSCNSTCQCDAFPVSPECTLDSDCDQFNANSCIEAKCTSNTCSYELTPGATCSSTTGCGSSSQICNSTCQCEDISVSFNCTVDGDCQVDNSNPCVEAKCISGSCSNELTAGATCSSTTQCSSGQSCNSTCQCETISIPTTFSDASFAIYDNADATKIAMFSAADISTSTTRIYTLPNVADSELAYTSGTVSGNVFPSSAPWALTFDTTYRYSRISKHMVFEIDSNTHTSTGSQSGVIYSALIPVGLRPSAQINWVFWGTAQSITVAIVMQVKTSGNVEFYRIDSSGFLGSGFGNNGHSSCAVSWIIP